MKKISAVLFSLLLAACASTPAPKPDATQQANDKKASTPSNTDTAQVSMAAVESSKLKAEMQELQIHSVYFDFDQNTVKPEFADAIKKQAEFLINHKDDAVTVEGNTDERGSSECNLALGSKRASAVKKNLFILGVSATRIKESSFGEEKPRLTCPEESCWKENRRVDFTHRLNE